jgi:hypothetical protein
LELSEPTEDLPYRKLGWSNRLPASHEFLYTVLEGTSDSLTPTKLGGRVRTEHEYKAASILADHVFLSLIGREPGLDPTFREWSVEAADTVGVGHVPFHHICSQDPLVSRS